MVIIIFIFVILFTGCAKDNSSINSSTNNSSSEQPFQCPKNQHNNPTVIIFGDSLAADPNGWAIKFANKINLPYQNFAIGGTYIKSNNQYNTIMCVQINKDDIVVYQPGINDAYKDIPITEYKSLLETLINRLKQTGAIVLLGTTSRLLEDYFYMTNTKLDIYADVARQIEGVNLVDINNVFLPNNLNMADHVHPNALGYEEIANEYMRVFIGLFNYDGFYVGCL